jgi:hypothetical protein
MCPVFFFKIKMLDTSLLLCKIVMQLTYFFVKRVMLQITLLFHYHLFGNMEVPIKLLKKKKNNHKLISTATSTELDSVIKVWLVAFLC